MRSVPCGREDEVLDALQTSRWPEACDATLRAHVAACVPCTELIALVKPLLEEHRALVQEAPVPSSAIDIRNRSSSISIVTETRLSGLPLLPCLIALATPSRRAMEMAWVVSAESFQGFRR